MLQGLSNGGRLSDLADPGQLAQHALEPAPGMMVKAKRTAAELGIDPDDLVNPWHAAFASMLSFVAGAIIPLVTILATPTAIAVPATMIAVTLALALTGSTAARLGNAPALPATIRNIAGGLLAMGITYGIGLMVGSFGG